MHNNMEDQTTAATETEDEEVEVQEPQSILMTDVIWAITCILIAGMICTACVLCSDNFPQILDTGSRNINVTFSPITPGRWGGNTNMVFNYPPNL